MNTPITLVRLLTLIRNVNHGNAIISTYQSNFNYNITWDFAEFWMPTEAIIYDDNCSCGMYSNCTTQATFIDTDSSEVISVNGLKVGCLPSEALRASTLECFYDSACIDLIQQSINYSSQIIPLSPNINRSLVNRTIAELIDNLFVEQWTTTNNYSSYFHQCSPLSCTYSYVERINALYTVTFLLGLQGGLSIVLRWLCPRIIRILFKILTYKKNRRNPIRPVESLEIAPVQSTINDKKAPAHETSRYVLTHFIYSEVLFNLA
jgi:hypothetical protein